MYNDFGTLASLRTEARADEAGTLGEVAQQFESIFVQMMLSSMRDATMKGGLFESHQLETYEQMFDQQLSLDLARQGGVGLADVIVRQLGGETAAPTDPASGGMRLTAGPSSPSLPGSPGGSGDTLSVYRARALPSPAPSVRAPATGFAETGVGDGARAPLAAAPAAFVDELRPLAEGAARELGVAPDVLLAQAALETGWGQHVIADGRGSSNNLFNIKAGGDWSGPVVSVRTVEYRDGLAVRETAAFRAYASPVEAFDDYVNLLRDNPRYAPALAAAGDPENYLRGLQDAGYATDPAYADKILAILDREELAGRGNLAAAESGLPSSDPKLKKTAQRPLAG